MKLPEFDHNQKGWDLYKAFHVHLNGGHRWNAVFVQFDTGELIVHRHNFKPGARRVYNDLNICIVSTTDYDCPALHTPKGEKLPKAWLTDHGGQTLLIDLDTKRAVKIARPPYATDPRAERPTVPTRFALCPVYFAGPGLPPVGGMPISVSRPFKWDPAEKAHIDGLIAASKAWCKLMPIFDQTAPGSTYGYGELQRVEGENLSLSTLQRVDGENLSLSTFNDLSNQVKVRLAKYGLRLRRNITQYDYLTIE